MHIFLLVLRDIGLVALIPAVLFLYLVFMSKVEGYR